MGKKLNSLFYFGLTLFLLPIFAILTVLLTIAITGNKTNPLPKIKPDSARVDRRIIYDTVRVKVEVPIKKPKKQKSVSARDSLTKPIQDSSK